MNKYFLKWYIGLCALFFTASCTSENHTAHFNKIAVQSSPTPSLAPAKNEPTQTIYSVNEDKTLDVQLDETAQLPPSLSETDIPVNGQTIEEFSPVGWHLLAKAEGDLNADNLRDAVAIFSKAVPSGTNNEVGTHKNEQARRDVVTRRLLVIALRDQKGLMRRDAISQKAIMCRTCGVYNDDNFYNLEIKNKMIVLQHDVLGPTHSSYTHKFQKRGEEWFVIGGMGEYRHRASGKTQISKQKLAIKFADFDISKENEKMDLSAESN